MTTTAKTQTGVHVTLKFTLPKMFLALKALGLQFEDLQNGTNSILFLLKYIEEALPEHYKDRESFFENLPPDQARIVMEAAKKSIEDKSSFFSQIAVDSAAAVPANEKA